MNSEMLGLVAIGVLLLLTFMGLPIWMCMILVGSVGYIILAGGHQALAMVASNTLATVQSYTFAVLPVFLLMGDLGDTSGMMTEAYQSITVWVGRLRGGLAMASVVGAAAFSCVSGSSMACAAIMTKVALPRLLDHKYDPQLATGALAAGGTLGNIVPPGILLVVYALLAEVSLGQFFVACYLPGFLLTLMYCLQIYIQCKLKPSLGPGAHSTTFKEKLIATKGLLAVFAVLFTVLGGIQFGVFTPNEAASIATIIVFIYALARRTVNGRNLLQAFRSTLVVTGMALAILVGANVLNVFIAVSGLPQALAQWLLSLHLSSLGLVLLIQVVYFILGIPLDPTSTLLLTLPILLPVLNAFHVNLLWFGVLAILQVELGNLTPPVGLNLFVVAALVKPKGISMSTVFKGSIPFCVTCLLFILLLVFFPQISLFMVSLMKK